MVLPVRALILTAFATPAFALVPLDEGALGEVAARDGITLAIATDAITAQGLSWTDDGRAFTLGSLAWRAVDSTGNPLATQRHAMLAVDAGGHSSNSSSVLALDFRLANERHRFAATRIGTALPAAFGGIAFDGTGTLATTLLLNGAGADGAFAANFSDAHLFLTGNGRQVALQNMTAALAIPALRADIETGGLRLTAPAANLSLTGGNFTFRNGGTAFTTAGTASYYGVDFVQHWQNLNLLLRGGGAVGSDGLTLALAGTLANTSSLSFRDDGNTLYYRNLSGSLAIPRLTLDVVAGDALRMNIGEFSAPGTAGRTANLVWQAGDVNVNTGAGAGARLGGLRIDIGRFDGTYLLTPGTLAGEGLRLDYQWTSDAGAIRIEDGANYVAWSNMSSFGQVNNMQLMLAADGVRWSMPDWRGGFSVGGATVNGQPHAWDGSLGYALALDATFRPGGASGQGLSFDATVTVTDPAATFVSLGDDGHYYRFGNAGGTISINDASVDVAGDALVFSFPDNRVSPADPARIGAITIDGTRIGELQFRGFDTAFELRVRGH